MRGIGKALVCIGIVMLFWYWVGIKFFITDPMDAIALAVSGVQNRGIMVSLVVLAIGVALWVKTLPATVAPPPVTVHPPQPPIGWRFDMMQAANYQITQRVPRNRSFVQFKQAIPPGNWSTRQLEWAYHSGVHPTDFVTAISYIEAYRSYVKELSSPISGAKRWFMS